MAQAAKHLTFEEYLALEDWDELPEGRCEFVNGELVELPPESDLNDLIAVWLQFELAKLVGLRLARANTCEVEVPVVTTKDPKTRYPDLVILRQEHLPAIVNRLTIKLDMPPPQLVVEVVSSKGSGRQRDYERKRKQYQKRGIPEYWLIDPERQVVIVLALKGEEYNEVGTFRGSNRIESSTFP